ncbi:MAG: ribonuclease HI family protein [Armatimonadetes bacterium]|nr:ribonuclease HI family protein [Armatimonadota bacterium]
MRVRLYTDGACSGNPGPAGIGYVILGPDGTELQAVGAAIGRATNNIAEYTAHLRGLAACRELGASTVDVVSDSELMVRQLTGRYRVKDAKLAELHAEALRLAREFEKVTWEHTLRGGNSRADGLAAGAIRSQR